MKIFKQVGILVALSVCVFVQSFGQQSPCTGSYSTDYDNTNDEGCGIYTPYPDQCKDAYLYYVDTNKGTLSSGNQCEYYDDLQTCSLGDACTVPASLNPVSSSSQ